MKLLKYTDSHLYEEVRPPLLMRPSFSREWWLLIPKYMILVEERSLTGILSSHVTCNTSLWSLLRLDGWSERPDLISRQVISSPSIYKGPDRIFLIVLMANKHPTIFILNVQEGCSWGSTVSRERFNGHYFYQCINTNKNIYTKMPSNCPEVLICH